MAQWPKKEAFPRVDILERKLKKDLDLVLKQEESVWKQKSRVHWFSQRDGNTRFFHLSTIIRRRRNKIDKLKIEGNWVCDQNIIIDHIMGYLNHIFATPISLSIMNFAFPYLPD